MFESYTEKAVKVIMLAQEESRRLGHNFVGSEQILLGLIGEGTGIAAKVLKSMGVNLRDARVEVEKIIGRGKGHVAVEIPFTPTGKRILELTAEESRLFGDSYISTEHLLLALIRESEFREGESLAIRVLKILGINLSIMRRQVLRLLGKLETEEVKTVEINNGILLDSFFFRRFTKKIIQSLILSSQEASNLKQIIIDLEIIFLGLIKDKTSVASKFLHSMGITLEDTTNIIVRRLNSRAFSSEELKLLEVLQTLTNQLNLELCKVTIDIQNAEIRQDFDSASQLRDREKDIKMRISLLKMRIAPDTWQIFEHIFVKDAWEIKFSNESVKALKLAVEESQKLKHNHVSSEHLLLGLLDTGGIEFVDFLEELGTHPVTLRKRLDKLLSGEAYTSRDANVYVENFVNHGEFMSEKSINFTARDISGSVVNLGEINGNVTNTINQLSDSQSPNKSELADLLTQLQSAVNSEDSGLDDKDKAKALKHIESIGKLGSKQNDATLREKAEDALDALIGIGGKFASFFGIAKPLIDSVKSILNL